MLIKATLVTELTKKKKKKEREGTKEKEREKGFKCACGILKGF